MKFFTLSDLASCAASVLVIVGAGAGIMAETPDEEIWGLWIALTGIGYFAMWRDHGKQKG